MKILFISVGKKHEAALAEAIDEFTSRIGRYCPVEWKIIPSAETPEKEGAAILAAVGERDYAVLLDEQGKELPSAGLASFLEKRLNEGVHRLVLIIGGAFGADAAVRTRAQAMLSLSLLTFPHQLARLILAEQVYRAFTIIRGEKYHH